MLKLIDKGLNCFVHVTKFMNDMGKLGVSKTCGSKERSSSIQTTQMNWLNRQCVIYPCQY